MPRPKNDRLVNRPPLYADFKPSGTAINSLEQINLSLDEFEAIRLADYIGLQHEEAAGEMNISRSTFTRIIARSRKKIADFLIHGKLLSIEGGNIHFRNNIIECQNCGFMIKTHIGKVFSSCPECESTKLLNLAGGFGHGNCCRIEKGYNTKI